MKITKTRLRQIIKEELENIQEMDNLKDTSALMRRALRSNEIPSLSSLRELKPEHSKMIKDLNDKAKNLKMSMGNVMALSLAISRLKNDNLEPADDFLKKR